MLSQTLVIRASHNLARANRAGEITIRESLDLLDGPFAELADGVAEDLYALWLGSAISLSRMPGLIEVAMAVLDHFQHRVEAGNPSGSGVGEPQC